MDITTLWDSANCRADWSMQGPILATGSDLQTAVVLSLFTDRQAGPDDLIPDGTTDRRGWWADPSMGSRLWLLQRAKQTQDTLQRAYDYIVEALAWLKDDGVVADVLVYVEWTRAGMLGAQVTLIAPDGTRSQEAFTWAWQQGIK